MIKVIFLFSITILFSAVLPAQLLSVAVNYTTSDETIDKHIIFYQPGQLLAWDDFKGQPVEESDAVALTNAGFSLKLAFHQVGNISQLVIDVNCNFSEKKSWVKNGNKTPYILNHEQKHFDIAYIHTRLFIQKLKNAAFKSNNYEAVITKIHNETAAAMSKMQNQYDLETNHSRITDKQMAWDEKISKLLALVLIG